MLMKLTPQELRHMKQNGGHGQFRSVRRDEKYFNYIF